PELFIQDEIRLSITPHAFFETHFPSRDTSRNHLPGENLSRIMRLLSRSGRGNTNQARPGLRRARRPWIIAARPRMARKPSQIMLGMVRGFPLASLSRMEMPPNPASSRPAPRKTNAAQTGVGGAYRAPHARHSRSATNAIIRS